MSRARRSLASVAMVTCCALGSQGCEPMPDYRIVVRNIPADTQALVVGALLDGDIAARTYRTIPVGDLDEAARQRFTIALAVSNADAPAAVLSVGTVDRSGCLTSVASSNKLTRSGSFTASTAEIQLNPCLNPELKQLATGYDDPVSCPKLPGLTVNRLGEVQELSTAPVIILTRRLVGSADSVLEGTFTAYGWGMDRGTMSIAINPATDTNRCQDEARRIVTTIAAPGPYRDLLLSFVNNTVASYPLFTLTSYAQVDLRFRSSDQTMSPLPMALLNQLVQCFAITSQIYTKLNPDGNQVVFREVTPNAVMASQRKAKQDALCMATCGATSCP